MNSRSVKRRRRRPPAHYQSVTAAEERFLQQAIQNSKLDKGRRNDIHVPPGPTFYPTVADFQGNPLDFIESIRPIAEKYGICKIVPPPGWNPAPCFAIDFKSDKKFQTKNQMLHRLQEGISFGDGEDYVLEQYQKTASERTKVWKETYYPDHDLLSRHADILEKNQDENSKNASKSKRFTAENLERDYWDIVETHSKEVSVEYGNDVDTQVFGSGFPLSQRGRSVCGTKDPDKMNQPEPKFGTEEYYRETWWNLNNIPCAPDSVLRHVKVGINGVNVPWMYFGSLFTTFCWHTEDNYMYSINYNHKGAPKQWYGVPGSKQASDGLERVFKSYLSMKMRDVPDLLHHITTMFSPRLLQNAKVPVYKILQHEGEFVVTFPRSFHSGFSLGPNIGEAVNFATHDWIAHGSDANERYRSFARPAVFSHDRLTFTMARHLKDQKAYSTCKLLLEELERVVEEELKLRRELLEAGVRDVSDLIELPKNALDQLDERSANYDDKRLCHHCKHICFFSAVACECSQSKVSCLRHSHFMCRCANERKYFMIWSPDEELLSTLDRVRSHCESLKTDDVTKLEAVKSAEIVCEMPDVAPGSEMDKILHAADEINTDPVTKACMTKTALPDRSRASKSEGIETSFVVSSPRDTCSSSSGRVVSVSSPSDLVHRSAFEQDSNDDLE